MQPHTHAAHWLLLISRHCEAGAAAKVPATGGEAAAYTALPGEPPVNTEKPATDGAAVAEHAQSEAVCEEARARQSSQQQQQQQQGCLKLDLSSEEDPLLCTQRMPSTQGKLS